tara:strand:- start:1209 stop:1721 length:513 start_codon:yes stop_codon:yes gene_type:complete
MNKEILIPTSWQDVTLGEFIALSKLDIDSYKTPIEYYIHMLRVFGNENIEDIFEYIKAVDINNIVGQMSFLNTPPKQLDNKSIKIGNETFHLIKSLNDITVGEYVSIESLIEQGKLDSVEAIPIILSVILRPLDEDFDSGKCTERIKLFKQSLSIEDVLGMSVFFSIGVR